MCKMFIREGGRHTISTGASRATSIHNIRKPAVGCNAIQPGVQESQRLLAGLDAGVVEQTDDSGEGGRGRRGAADLDDAALGNYTKVSPLGGDVGETASGWVVQVLEGASYAGEIRGHGRLLVLRGREHVREPARREGDGGLGLDSDRAADRCHVRAGGGEDGEEPCGVLAVISLASAARAGAEGRGKLVSKQVGILCNFRWASAWYKYKLRERRRNKEKTKLTLRN